MNRSLGVLQLTDSLAIGGTERVAVNLTNMLAEHGVRSYLCATRCEGPLLDLVNDQNPTLLLRRQRMLEYGALRRLVTFIGQNDIQILHAHSSSLLMAGLASLFTPFPVVVWHDHYGRVDVEGRSAFVYRQLARRVRGVISVNEPLQQWARKQLRIPDDRVWYVPNFVTENANAADDCPTLPGSPGSRIVCVANFRPQKDHRTLVRAMAKVVTVVPNAHLVLVGSHNDAEYLSTINQDIATLGLGDHISNLGPRSDVPAILRACDIGVLSSVSEGLPLSLLEYGMAGLAPIATRVGQCEEVLQNTSGILVDRKDAESLAAAMVRFLTEPEWRYRAAESHEYRVRQHYSANVAIRKIQEIYDTVLSIPECSTKI